MKFLRNINDFCLVIPSSYCQVLCLEESTDELIKHTSKTGVYGHEDSEDDGEGNLKFLLCPSFM